MLARSGLPRFAVVGVGGVGGYFGARLAEAGHDVTFIARGDHLAAIRESGLRVDSASGDVVVCPARATDDPREVGVVDYVIMGVKAWQVSDAARAAIPLVGASTSVLTLQNGIEAADQISSVLGPQHALGGLAKIVSFLVGPGHIKHDGWREPTLEIGELDGTRSERVTALCELFQQAKGVTATVSPDIREAIWAKFLLITAWGGVGAVTRAPIGVIRSVPETRLLLENVLEEIERVARAKHVQLPPGVVPTTMAYFDSFPPQGTSSMQRDLVAGKPSELESLSGAVTRLGADVGVATPTNTTIYRALVPLERRARKQLEF